MTISKCMQHIVFVILHTNIDNPCVLLNSDNAVVASTEQKLD